jgi:cell division transport system ATP-binding protein
VIHFDNVTKVYPTQKRPALDGVSIDVDKGEFVFLVGPSGSGKSTMLRLINREEVADDGQLFVAGKDIAKLSSWRVPYLRRNIGCIFQDYKLLTNKTVYENVAFALEVIGRPRHVVHAQVPAILELVGLAEKADNLPEELSGGEQQMLVIGRALLAKPRILLLDEPSMGLAPKLVREVFEIIERIRSEENLTLLLVEQNAHMALRLAERAYLMETGSIVLDGSADELMQDPRLKEVYLGGLKS